MSLARLYPNFNYLPPDPGQNTTVTIVSLVLIGIFILAISLIIKSQWKTEKGWDNDQWTKWWDREILPDEPGPGGIKLPETEDRLVVEAVGSKGSGA